MSASIDPSNALRFRVLFAGRGAGSGPGPGSGCGSGSKTDDTRTSGYRYLAGEFASAFTTFETTFVSATSAPNKSSLLATTRLGPDLDARPAA